MFTSVKLKAYGGILYVAINTVCKKYLKSKWNVFYLNENKTIVKPQVGTKILNF